MTTTNFCTIAGMNKTPLFAERLKKLRIAVGISQSDIARTLGVTPQAVQKWEQGQSAPRRGKMKALADVLSTKSHELIQGTELEEFPDSANTKDVRRITVFPERRPNPGTRKTESGTVPLISWAQAADWGTGMETLAPHEAQDWLRCPFDHGPAAFVIKVEGESNFDPIGTKSYAPGEFIYVDPALTPTNRKMIVVRVDREERAQLRQLLMDERGTRMLKSLNPSWPNPVIPMPDNARIVGVVIGKWVPE